MPLTGTINSGRSGPTPTGTMCCIGLDGKHYLPVASSDGATAYVMDADDLTTQTLDTATFRADFAALSTGVTFALSGGLPGFWPKVIVPVPGTEKFVWLGYSFDSYSSTGTDVALCVIYEIQDDATINAIGGGIWQCTGHGTTPDVSNYMWAANLIDGALYALLWMGQSIFTTGDAYLVKLPLSGVTAVLSAGSWSSQIKAHPSGLAHFTSITSRFYTNRATIVKDPSGVGVFDYVGFPEYGALGYSAPKMGYAVFAADLSSVGSVLDRSADFGIPFSDSGKNFSGALSGHGRDDYTAPSSSGGELIMGRSFSDNRQWVRARRFVWDEAAGTVTAFATEEFQATADVFASPVDQVQFSLEGGTTLETVMDDQSIFRFGFAIVTDHDTPPEDVPSEEDEDDFRGPCDVDWPTCDLTPQNIRVEVVSPTVSPGRSFTSREQIVQSDAGSWRIVYENIRIVDRAHALQWREIESKLNGRVGVVCVPVYEAKFSDTPVAATCSGGASVGSVYVDIEQTAGVGIVAGQHFTAGDRLYRIKDVLRTVGGVTTVKLWPPLREDIAADLALDFNTPSCRCRLATDQEMNIRLELLRFAAPSVTFLEDV